MTEHVPRTARRRIVYAGAIPVVALLGLATRRCPGRLPGFVAEYGGDTLWALAAFLLFGLLLASWSTPRVAAAAFLFACAVELSQLYHAPWLDAIRGTRVGAWILGYGFLWSDLLCYAAGILLGAALEALVLARFARITGGER